MHLQIQPTFFRRYKPRQREEVGKKKKKKLDQNQKSSGNEPSRRTRRKQGEATINTAVWLNLVPAKLVEGGEVE